MCPFTSASIFFTKQHYFEHCEILFNLVQSKENNWGKGRGQKLTFTEIISKKCFGSISLLK